MMNLEFPVTYLFFPHLSFPGPRHRGGTPAHMALSTPGTPPDLNLCYCGRQGQAYPSRHTRRGAASLPRLMLDAGGREWARVALKDKELHKPQFFVCLSSIYITLHIFQMHLMWNDKLLDSIWRWMHNFTTSHEISRSYEFNWTKNKCLSCICHTETCDSELSFHESEQAVPEVNVISSEFLCMIFLMWIFCFVFPRNICQAKVLSVLLCVHMY